MMNQVKNQAPWLSIHKKWAILFGLWLILLSGSLAKFVSTPGILQAYRLNSLLEAKRFQLSQMQAELGRLQAEAGELETNPYAQVREIRKVLGYAARDEIIFDFNITSQF